MKTIIYSIYDKKAKGYRSLFTEDNHETDFHYDQSQINDKRSMLGKSYPANNHVNAYKKQLMLDRKEARKENALKHKEDNTAVRREAKEKCLKHKTNQLLRETL